MSRPAPTRSRRSGLRLAWLAASLAVLVPSTSRSAERSDPARASAWLESWRLDRASPLIDALVRDRPGDPSVRLLSGTLLMYQGRYAEAATELGAAVKATAPAQSVHHELLEMEQLARQTAEVTRGYVSTASTAGHFVVSVLPGPDAILVPYALEALERAYDALGTDFGDRADGPIRVEIYPSVDELSRVSTLTRREIEASGTIALCKFNRLMIVSPRALATGYPWLDTLNHEYTHYVVTRVSEDSVPIWLHEGIAKFEERRWRGGPGGGLSPMMEHLLARALADDRLVTLEEMHPSMAKLPTQEMAALAFAEVYTIIEYLHGAHGFGAIREMLSALRDGASQDQAVRRAAGVGLAELQLKWKTWLKGRRLRTRPTLVATRLRFQDGRPPDEAVDESDPRLIADRDARRHARLGGLLRARHRLRAAAREYEKAERRLGRGHPVVSARLARTYLELGELDHAISTGQPVVEAYPDHGGPAATVAEALVRKDSLERAEPFLEAGLRLNPFDPAIHCGLARVYAARTDPRAERERRTCGDLGGR